MKKPFLFLLALGAAALLLLGFWPAHRVPEKGPKIQVVATFYPLAEFARQVGGGRVEVRALVPAGAEPHDYEPTPRDIVDASQADVFLMNGSVDAWADRILPDLRRDGVLTMRLQDDMPDIARDPHVWLDPVLAGKVVEKIHAALAAADAGDAAEFDTNASAYLSSLAELDGEYRKGLSACASHRVVASHDALGYMAKEYGLDVVPISGLSPDEEPSPARMAEIAALARSAGAKYIFTEALVSPKLAQAIAEEVGAKTLVFDPLEGLTAQDAESGRTYLSVMRDNLSHLRTALSCK